MISVGAMRFSYVAMGQEIVCGGTAKETGVDSWTLTVIGILSPENQRESFF